jgi:CBS domain-containing protein
MTVDVLKVGPDASVTHAAQLMLDRKVSGLPVLDDEGTLVGMITEGDLMRRFELRAAMPRQEASSADRAREYLKTRGWKVTDVMSRKVLTVDEEMPIGQIAALLEENGVKRAPVMRAGKLVGIVSRADLLRGLVAAKCQRAIVGDNALRLATMSRLSEDGGLSRLGVTVGEGVVHLWGYVGSEAERDAARAIAESVSGVVGVKNHIRVVAPFDFGRETLPAE